MKIWLLIFLELLVIRTYSQEDKDSYYVFGSDWKPTEIKNAKYFLRVRRESDSNFSWTYYDMFGPRIRVERYKDEKATIPNGYFLYYYHD